MVVYMRFAETLNLLSNWKPHNYILFSADVFTCHTALIHSTGTGGHACRAIANFTWAFPTVKSQISNVKKVNGYGNNVI